jgi:GR25 family glycosyltransferase involved in LPS biosynthesis
MVNIILILLLILLVLFLGRYLAKKEGMATTYLNGIDVIYWINLDRSVDRKNNMEELLGDAVFSGIPTQRISAFDGKKDTAYVMSHFKLQSPRQTDVEYACLLSHLETIRTFNNSKYRVALIFEDDVTMEFKQYWTKSVKNIMDNAPPDWDILLLSYMYGELNQMNLFYDWVSSDTNYDTVRDGKYFSTVAYLINKRGADKVMRNTYSKGKYALKQNGLEQVADVYLYGITNCYVYKYPMFIYNTDFKSTIHQDHVEYHVQSKEHIIHNYNNNLIVTALTKLYNKPNMGIEPMTAGLQGQRSTTELIRHTF